jgi:plastocyanin
MLIELVEQLKVISMKTLFTFFLFLVVIFSNDKLYATTFTVTNSGFTFSPSTLTISTGDEVSFVLESIHNAVQVSKATWDANGITSNGGFSVPFGGGKVTFSTAGTYYYVCTVHASLGMKGQIIVTNVTGLKQNSMNGKSLSVYPNPTSQFFTLKFSLTESTAVKIDLLDISGKRIKNLVSSVYASGDWTKAFPSEGLVPGLYLIRLTRNGKMETTSLVIAK